MTKTDTIRRADERPDGFVVVDRRTVQDARLSWAARGMLCYLLSLPDDWRIRTCHLEREAPCSAYRVQQTLAELEAAGYVRLERQRDERGKLSGSAWQVHERPAGTTEEAGEEARSASERKLYRHTRHVGPAREKTAIPADSATCRNTETRQTATPGICRGSADSAPLQSKENRRQKKEQQTKRARPSVPGSTRAPDREAVPLRLVRAGLDPADAGVTVPDGASPGAGVPDAAAAEKALMGMLAERGVEPRVARRLVRSFPADRVRRQVASFDQEREQSGGERPRSVGWLVRAIEKNYAPRAPDEHGPSEDRLLSYQAMLAWCERHGGLHLTAGFQPVRHPDGTVQFRRVAS